MTLQTNVTYLIYVDDDHIPITASMTVGNHLDNDVVIAGEDVADFHVRIELTDRGPVLFPLGDATANVNGTERDKPVQVIVGDVISIGQCTMQIGYELEADTSSVDHWVLIARDGGSEVEVNGEVAVGRAESADLCLLDTHISRYHARLLERDKIVWLQDLNSANGSRVNGNRIAGGARLFHGDTISFDQFQYQLLARGGDLTPVNKFKNPGQGTTLRPPEPTRDSRVRPGIAAATLDPSMVVAELVQQDHSVPGAVDTGRRRFPVAIGDNFLGTDAANDIVLDDPTIAERHARLTVKPEGSVLTSLLGRGHVRVNGADVSSCLLEDDDMLELGNVHLRFKLKPSASAGNTGAGSRRVLAWGAAALVAGAAIALLLLP